VTQTDVDADADDDQTTVWTATAKTQTGDDRRYHTDEDCTRFPGRVVERELGDIADRFTECKFCSGEAESAGGSEHGHRKALHRADPEDIP
jgi:hypothetical protein